MTAAEFAETGGRIAEVVRSGLPLAAGLHALAEELPSRSMRTVVLEISRRLERGEPLATAFGSTTVLPPAVSRVIQSGLLADNIPAVLEHYLAHTRARTDRRRRLILFLAYPAIVAGFSVLLMLWFLLWIAQDFAVIYKGFGTELPGVTTWILSVSDMLRHNWPWILTAGLGLAAATRWAYTSLWFAVPLRHCWRLVPIAGTLARDSALASFCEILAMLVEARSTLPEALRIAGGAAHDPVLAQTAGVVARYIEQGMSLADAAETTRVFPENVLYLFRWEQHPDEFADALRAMAELFSRKCNSQAMLVGLFLEPIVLSCAIGGLCLLVLAFFLPLIKLLNDLS